MNKVLNDNMIVKQVILDDSSCTSCASVIEYHYNKLAGIEASVNFATNKIKFTYDKTQWNEEKIAKVMKKIGYKISAFQNLEKSVHQHTSAEHNLHLEKYHDYLTKFHHTNKKEIIRIIIGLLFLLPLLAPMINISAFTLLDNVWLQLTLASIIQFCFGYSFYVGFYREVIKQKWPGMNTLIVFATLIPYFYSIYKIINLEQLRIQKLAHLYFESSSSIIMIVLLGELISSFIKTKAINGLDPLVNWQKHTALVITDDAPDGRLINIENIKVNDKILVRKGEAIPTDGVLLSKQAFINEALITGESQLITKSVNDEVIGGTINSGESFYMQAVKIGKDTILANIIKAVEQAQGQKLNLQKIADKIAVIFIPTIIVISLVVFMMQYFWWTANNLDRSIEIAIATLIIACPCAFGIATPLAVAIGVNKAAGLGIIYNKISAFEKITKINTICFDKTGTLTTGELAITKIYGDKTHLPLAIALEKYSTHPIAAAFSKYQQENNITNTNINLFNVKEEISTGITATWAQQKVFLGNFKHLLAKQIVIDQKILQANTIATICQNQMLVALVIADKIVNIYALGDNLQSQAATIIKKIQQKNINVYLISGDEDKEVSNVAKKLAIKHYYSNVKPIMKAEIVKKLQAAGNKVAFIGDGINDIVALEQADLAIVMGKGSDIAKSIGDITLVNNNISAVYQAIKLTKITKNYIWLNFLWAFCYNLAFIPLAAFGFFMSATVPIAIVAGITMVISEMTVIFNSLIFKYRKINFD